MLLSITRVRKYLSHLLIFQQSIRLTLRSYDRSSKQWRRYKRNSTFYNDKRQHLRRPWRQNRSRAQVVCGVGWLDPPLQKKLDFSTSHWLVTISLQLLHFSFNYIWSSASHSNFSSTRNKIVSLFFFSSFFFSLFFFSVPFIREPKWMCYNITSEISMLFIAIFSKVLY